MNDTAPPPKKRTWLWVVFGIFFVLFVMAVAGLTVTRALPITETGQPLASAADCTLKVVVPAGLTLKVNGPAPVCWPPPLVSVTV